MITVLIFFIVNILPNSMNPETVSNHSVTETDSSFAVYTNRVVKRWGSSKYPVCMQVYKYLSGESLTSPTTHQ